MIHPYRLCIYVYTFNYNMYIYIYMCVCTYVHQILMPFSLSLSIYIYNIVKCTIAILYTVSRLYSQIACDDITWSASQKKKKTKRWVCFSTESGQHWVSTESALSVQLRHSWCWQAWLPLSCLGNLWQDDKEVHFLCIQLVAQMFSLCRLNRTEIKVAWPLPNSSLCRPMQIYSIVFVFQQEGDWHIFTPPFSENKTNL